ncbi:unnamed protein product, partial [Linum tenue]
QLLRRQLRPRHWPRHRNQPPLRVGGSNPHKSQADLRLHDRDHFPAICKLDQLTTLIVADWKSLSGEILDCVSSLSNLRVLDLVGNSHSGQIPSQIGNLGRLVVLNLADNRTSGEIPASVSKLECLNHLELNNNQIYGRIPTYFRNLKMLSLACQEPDGRSHSRLHSVGRRVRDDVQVSRRAATGVLRQQRGEGGAGGTLSADLEGGSDLQREDLPRKYGGCF